MKKAFALVLALAMGCLLILAVTLDRFFGASRKN